MRLSITFIFVLAVLTATLPTTAAFGMSPASTSLQSPSNETYELRLINNQAENITLRLSTDGHKDFINLQNTTITLTPDTKEVRVPITMDTPPGTLPGTYDAGVIIEQEVPSYFGGDYINAIPAVRHKITVTIPAEGKFVDAHITTNALETNNTARITVHAKSVGTQHIDELSARIDIRSPTNELLYTTHTTTTSLPTEEERALTVTWTPNNEGWYGIQATINYDGRSTTTHTTAQVGRLHLQPRTILFGPYTLGDIVRIDAPVTSTWNNNINNVYATYRVTQEEQTLTTFTSLSENIAPRGDATITAYWNTAGLTPGTYKLEQLLYYADKTTSTNYTIILGIDDIKVQQPASKNAYGLYALLVILIGIAITALLHQKRQKL